MALQRRRHETCFSETEDWRGEMKLEDAHSDGFYFLHGATSLVFLEVLKEWDKGVGVKGDRGLMVKKAESRHHRKHIRGRLELGESMSERG